MFSKKQFLGVLLYGFYIILSVLSILLSIEVIGRVIIHFQYGVPGKSYGLWQADSELGADHRPNSYNRLTVTNNYGFRNREDVFEPKPEHSLRIIAFGGSTTFGYNLKDDETYTNQLELRLKKVPGYENTQVLNAGRICFSSGHNLILMKRLVPKLKPDYVILYEGVNEMMNAWAIQQDGISLDSLAKAREYGLFGKSLDQNRWLKRNSIICRFVDYVVKKAIVEKQNAEQFTAEEPPLHPWVIKNFEINMTNILDFLLDQNVKPIVVRYASVRVKNQKVFANIAADIAHKKGVTVFDMQAYFEKFGDEMKNYFIETGVHVTPEGAGMVAENLSRLILEQEKKLL